MDNWKEGYLLRGKQCGITYLKKAISYVVNNAVSPVLQTRRIYCVHLVENNANDQGDKKRRCQLQHKK